MAGCTRTACRWYYVEYTSSTHACSSADCIHERASVQLGTPLPIIGAPRGAASAAGRPETRRAAREGRAGAADTLARGQGAGAALAPVPQTALTAAARSPSAAAAFCPTRCRAANPTTLPRSRVRFSSAHAHAVADHDEECAACELPDPVPRHVAQHLDDLVGRSVRRGRRRCRGGCRTRANPKWPDPVTKPLCHAPPNL
jgi:hypothetical protein